MPNSQQKQSPPHRPSIASAPSIDVDCNKLGKSKSYPLPFALERLIIKREALKSAGQPVSPAVICRCLEISGPLNIAALRVASQAIVERQPALRTLIFANPDIPEAERTQRMAEAIRTGIFGSGLYLQSVGNSHPPLKVHEAADQDMTQLVQHILQLELATSFQCEAPPRLRMNLVRQSETSHVLILTIDHLVSDGRSLNILLAELKHCYEHFACGALLSLPPSGVSYLWFSEQQQLACGSSGFEEDLDYWEDHWRQFTGARLRPVDIPFVEPSPGRSRMFAKESLTICERDRNAFRQAARRARVTPYVFFLGAFVTVLHLYTRRDELSLWTHCANRDQDSVNTIGFYINSHLMGFRVSPKYTASDLLREVAHRHFLTLKHQRMPLPLLWQRLHCCPRFPDGAVMLDYLDDGCTEWTSGPVRFRQLSIAGPHPGRLACICVIVTDHGRTLSIHSDYITALYPKGAVETMLRDMVTVCRSFAMDLGLPLSAFREIAERYASRRQAAGSEMDEVIVSGGSRMPSRT